jgi:hypothetical protein
MISKWWWIFIDRSVGENWRYIASIHVDEFGRCIESGRVSFIATNDIVRINMRMR